MRRVLDWIRFTLISFECVILIGAFAAYKLNPQACATVGKSIRILEAPLIYGGLLGLWLLVGASWRIAWQVLLPEDKYQELLRGWLEYQGFWDRTVFSIAICSASALAASGLWVMRGAIADDVFGAFFSASLLLPLVSIASVGLAALTIRRILSRGT